MNKPWKTKRKNNRKPKEKTIENHENELKTFEKYLEDSKIDEKNERLRVLELNNTRMVSINCDLERNNKKLNVAERKMQEEVRKEHLMKKQIFEEDFHG